MDLTTWWLKYIHGMDDADIRRGKDTVGNIEKRNVVKSESGNWKKVYWIRFTHFFSSQTTLNETIQKAFQAKKLQPSDLSWFSDSTIIAVLQNKTLELTNSDVEIAILNASAKTTKIALAAFGFVKALPLSLAPHEDQQLLKSGPEQYFKDVTPVQFMKNLEEQLVNTKVPNQEFLSYLAETFQEWHKGDLATRFDAEFSPYAKLYIYEQRRLRGTDRMLLSRNIAANVKKFLHLEAQHEFQQEIQMRIEKEKEEKEPNYIKIINYQELLSSITLALTPILPPVASPLPSGMKEPPARRTFEMLQPRAVSQSQAFGTISSSNLMEFQTKRPTVARSMRQEALPLVWTAIPSIDQRRKQIKKEKIYLNLLELPEPSALGEILVPKVGIAFIEDIQQVAGRLNKLFYDGGQGQNQLNEILAALPLKAKLYLYETVGPGFKPVDADKAAQGLDMVLLGAIEADCSKNRALKAAVRKYLRRALANSELMKKYPDIKEKYLILLALLSK